MADPDDDPVYLDSRREALVILLAWLACLVGPRPPEWLVRRDFARLERAGLDEPGPGRPDPGRV